MSEQTTSPAVSVGGFQGDPAEAFNPVAGAGCCGSPAANTGIGAPGVSGTADVAGASGVAGAPASTGTPCCGTSADAKAEGSCCGSEAKTEAVATGACGCGA